MSEGRTLTAPERALAASIFGGAPIASDWGVNAFPTMFVLDAEGKIRFKGVRGDALDEAVQELLDELTEKSSK